MFIFDDGFVQAASVAISSLIVNKQDDTDYHIYILTPGLNSESKSIIQQFEDAPWNSSVEILEVSTDKYESIYTQFDGNTGAGSITALLKFDIPQVVSEDKVLYLDADILVKKDLSDLFNVDLTDYVAAVVKDSGKIYSNGGLREQIENYFNSGVMLLNLEMMRNEGFTERLIEAKISLNNINLVDQDAFNLAFQDRVTVVPNRFNCLWINLVNSAGKFTMNQLNEFYGTNYSCLWELEDDAYIIHFASKEKPWKYTDTPYSFIWNGYYSRSPCAHIPLNRTVFFSEKSPITEIPIILATDANYTPQTGITILSALENRESDIPYHFYILTPDVFNDSIMEKFKQIEDMYGNCFIKTVFMGDAFKNTNMNIPHISFPTFYRLMAPTLFPQYKKMIYMDSDVAVEGDLTEYFSTDLNGFYLGGVMAASYHWASDGNRLYCEENGIPAIDQYINAGVILMNLEEMRRDGLVEKFLELVPLGLRSQDQDILNRVCYGHIKQLPYKYDAMIAKYEPVPEQNKKIFSDYVINEGNNLPVITHYAAEIKPWASLSCALADRWWMYAKMSPFFEYMRDKFYDKMIENGKNDRLNRAIGESKLVYGAVKRKKKVNAGYVADLKRFDELWKSKDSASYPEMYEICSRQVRYLSPQFMGRMARLYRDGKGVERNYYKAAHLMKFALDAGVKWAEIEYVDILLKIDDEQSAIEAFDLCTIGANKGLAFSQCRLARMYRDGVGVESDLDEAIKWMRLAISQNTCWATEYVDMLMSSDDDRYRLEAYEFCKRDEFKDNPNLVFKLSIIYGYGKGIPVDMDKAIGLMSHAAELGHKKADEELIKLKNRRDQLISKNPKAYYRSVYRRVCESSDPEELSEIREMLAPKYYEGVSELNEAYAAVLWRLHDPESLKKLEGVCNPLVDEEFAHQYLALIELGRSGYESRQFKDHFGRALELNSSMSIMWNNLLETKQYSVLIEIIEPGLSKKSAVELLDGCFNSGDDICAFDGVFRKINLAFIENYLSKSKQTLTEASASRFVHLCDVAIDMGSSAAAMYAAKLYLNNPELRNLSTALHYSKFEYQNGGGADDMMYCLWNIGTDGCLSELVDVAFKLDTPVACAYLGRVYRSGRGVAKDLSLSADYYSKALDNGVKWAVNEYMEVLWGMGTDESYARLFSVAKEAANEGNAVAMIRLGKAYYLGNGTDCNYEAAAEWLMKGHDLGVTWADRELVNSLILVKTPESLDAALAIADRKNKDVMISLGNAFRDLAVDPSGYLKSAECYRAASRKDSAVAINMLFPVLELIGDTESINEIVQLATVNAKNGNKQFMRYLAAAYRDGRIVPKDDKLSEEWDAKARAAENKG